MNSLVTARFDNRDMADLALMRLRRNGVRFSVDSLQIDGGERSAPRAELYSPYNSNMTNQLGSADLFFPPVGYRAIFGRGESVPTRDAILKVSVLSDDIPRARDILRSAQGRGISVGQGAIS